VPQFGCPSRYCVQPSLPIAGSATSTRRSSRVRCSLRVIEPDELKYPSYPSPGSASRLTPTLGSIPHVRTCYSSCFRHLRWFLIGMIDTLGGTQRHSALSGTEGPGHRHSGEEHHMWPGETKLLCGSPKMAPIGPGAGCLIFWAWLTGNPPSFSIGGSTHVIARETTQYLYIARRSCGYNLLCEPNFAVRPCANSNSPTLSEPVPQNQEGTPGHSPRSLRHSTGGTISPMCAYFG